MAGYDLSADRSGKRSDPFIEFCGREKDKGIKPGKKAGCIDKIPSTCQVRENSFS
jgi:hypothetical protein